MFIRVIANGDVPCHRPDDSKGTSAVEDGLPTSGINDQPDDGKDDKVTSACS